VTDSLGVLLRSLQLAGLDIDAEAALDSLWLGREIRARGARGRRGTRLDVSRCNRNWRNDAFDLANRRHPEAPVVREETAGQPVAASG